MQLLYIASAVTTALLSAVSARAETHTVQFNNLCGTGTPQLIQGNNVLSSGEPFTSNGPFSSAIAYLQTGPCLFNGENCLIVEMTLVNPTSPGAGSSVDMSLIPPHEFNVETSFTYFDGCDGQGNDCNSESCTTAFHNPNDFGAQVQCEVDNVNLLITFCGNDS